jgi:hypothetical protein
MVRVEDDGPGPRRCFGNVHVDQLGAEALGSVSDGEQVLGT